MSGPANSRSVASKLAALLPKPASGHDGEVLATARAIGRVLETVSVDWHDLHGCARAFDRNHVLLGSAPATACAPACTGAATQAGLSETSHDVLLAEWVSDCTLHGMHRRQANDLRIAVAMADKLRRGHKLGT